MYPPEYFLLISLEECTVLLFSLFHYIAIQWQEYIYEWIGKQKVENSNNFNIFNSIAHTHEKNEILVFYVLFTFPFKIIQISCIEMCGEPPFSRNLFLMNQIQYKPFLQL